MSIVLDSKWIHGVPLIECFSDGYEDKKLIFYCHGYTCKKEDTYESIIELAKLGFFVVSIDAVNHGERIEEHYMEMSQEERDLKFFEIIQRTANDIKSLYEHHYKTQYAELVIMGVSMGGMISYLGATIIDGVKAIVPIIGTPSFVAFAKHSMAEAGVDLATQDEAIQELTPIDPMNHLKKFENMKILMIGGTQDEVVPCKWNKELYQLLVEHKITKEALCYEYDAGHDVTLKMKKDIYAWCVENLL